MSEDYANVLDDIMKGKVEFTKGKKQKAEKEIKVKKEEPKKKKESTKFDASIIFRTEKDFLITMRLVAQIKNISINTLIRNSLDNYINELSDEDISKINQIKKIMK